MKPIEPDVSRNFDAAQHLGFDIIERDFEADNGRCHPTSLGLGPIKGIPREMLA